MRRAKACLFLLSLSPVAQQGHLASSRSSTTRALASGGCGLLPARPAAFLSADPVIRATLSQDGGTRNLTDTIEQSIQTWGDAFYGPDRVAVVQYKHCTENQERRSQLILALP